MLSAFKIRSIQTARNIVVCNPYSEQIIDTVPKSTVEDVREAVALAKRYDFSLSAWQRCEILRRFTELLDAEREAVARLIAMESGKTIKDARAEIACAYRTFMVCAEEANRINGEVLPLDAVAGAKRGYGGVVREPLGVIVAITPPNFPLDLVAHKVGPAIAANNPIIVKPSSLTPLTALKMAEMLVRAGLPAQMLQVITGHSLEIGDELVTHPDVAKVTFGGSVEVGRAIGARMDGLRASYMALGASNPMIVLADADLDKAVPAAIDGAFGHNGQRCTSLSRLIVEEEIADRFIERLVDATRALVVGDPLSDATDVGPLSTESAAIKIEFRVAGARRRGAKLLHGGEREGALYWPAVLDRVHSGDPLVVEETFGPVAPIVRVRDYDHAIEVTNASGFGLQAGLFTNDLAKAMDASRRLEAGAVMINDAAGLRAGHPTFGGAKDSGIGRQCVRHAVESMTRTKTTVFGSA
ncbi:MAG: aldehyde dehydrogenase family protein [Gammaproteobacteria bacterium]